MFDPMAAITELAEELYMSEKTTNVINLKELKNNANNESNGNDDENVTTIDKSQLNKRQQRRINKIEKKQLKNQQKRNRKEMYGVVHGATRKERRQQDKRDVKNMEKAIIRADGKLDFIRPMRKVARTAAAVGLGAAALYGAKDGIKYKTQKSSKIKNIKKDYGNRQQEWDNKNYTPFLQKIQGEADSASDKRKKEIDKDFVNKVRQSYNGSIFKRKGYVKNQLAADNGNRYSGDSKLQDIANAAKNKINELNQKRNPEVAKNNAERDKEIKRVNNVNYINWKLQKIKGDKAAGKTTKEIIKQDLDEYMPFKNLRHSISTTKRAADNVSNATNRVRGFIDRVKNGGKKQAPTDGSQAFESRFDDICDEVEYRYLSGELTYQESVNIITKADIVYNEGGFDDV